MTTGTTTGIRQLEDRCWVLVRPDGKLWDDGDGVPHFAFAERARFNAGYEGVPELGQEQKPEPCWVATARCGAMWDEGGPYNMTHYATLGELVEAIEASDWRIRADGSLLCVGIGCGCFRIATEEEDDDD
jgi:hypothetical protein